MYSWFRTSDGGQSWIPINFGDLFTGEGPKSELDRRNSLISAYGNTVIIHPSSQMTNLKNVLLVSTDQGITWKEEIPEPKEVINGLEFKATFADDYHIGINGQANTATMPVVTFDRGKTFQYIEGDDIYRQVTADTTGHPYRAGINLACSNPNRWTVIVSPVVKKSGLATLTTNSGGSTWSLHQYYLPDDSLLWIKGQYGVDPRFIKGTSYLYFPTHQRYVVWTTRTGEYSQTSNQKTSYLYSSDYGATWNPETTFYKRRVAFEATAPGEVWMTLWRYEDLRAGTYADVIVHTTDFGKTWEIDSSTLHPHEFTPLDGNIIHFIDPRHGWIAASNDLGTIIFRYIASNDPATTKAEYSKYRYPILYPNPADRTFTVELSSTVKLQHLKIYDALGREYSCAYKAAQDNSVLIDCSNLDPGYYFVRMTTIFGAQEIVLTKPIMIRR